MDFYVRAVWDEDAQAYYSDSNIIGLNIEAKTVTEIYEIADEAAIELIIANHIDPAGLMDTPLKDIIPTIRYGDIGNSNDQRAAI